MIFNKHIRSQINEATQRLMSGGAAAVIKKALNGIPAGMGKPSSSPKIPEFVTDLLASLGLPSLNDVGTMNQYFWDQEQSVPPVPETEVEEISGGLFLTKSYTNQAGTRNYKVYIPSSYNGEAIPVIVMLHGCTQNPDDFAKGTRMNAIAEEMKCLVVYPAQSQSANSTKCWNWFKAINQQRDRGEPSIIAGITDQVISDYKLDRKRVYVAGLSSGGAMAIIMGRTYPDLYAAVGIHSGLPFGCAQDLPSAYAAMRGAQPKVRRKFQTSDADSQRRSLPIIVFHGDSDSTVHFSNAEQLINQNVSSAQARADRKDPHIIVKKGKVPNGHAFTQTLHQDENGRTVAEHWVIHGAGHAWAGGSKRGSYTDAQGPDASKEMMRFFYSN
ncbi:MAG: PHB depolymerase family esterase [Tatlockia sp.]|nr:PHB depolymerase family esterase [Tatlockia sp.]